MIQNVKANAGFNPDYNTNPGDDTTDKVFLLSIREAESLFASFEKRGCKGTAYCYEKGAQLSGVGSCMWWLRSSGENSCYAAYVDDVGKINRMGSSVYGLNRCVRPALWIRIKE